MEYDMKIFPYTGEEKTNEMEAFEWLIEKSQEDFHLVSWSYKPTEMTSYNDGQNNIVKSSVTVIVRKNA
jgi:hypothetical protein